MKISIYALSLVLIFGSGCKVAEKEFRKGNYDEAIDICVKKLIDNPDKAEYILILEEAFYRANGEDLAMIEMLNKEGRPDRWEEIYHIYESVHRRQNKIQPLMPIYLGTEERDAEFKFVNAVDGLNTAKRMPLLIGMLMQLKKLRVRKCSNHVKPIMSYKRSMGFMILIRTWMI